MLFHVHRIAHRGGDVAAGELGLEAQRFEVFGVAGDFIGRYEQVHEVEIGIYNITRFNPATNTTLAIDFELYGTVLASDKTEFEHEFEHNKARIREQVTMTLHGAASAGLTDAGLGLIKRRI